MDDPARTPRMEIGSDQIEMLRTIVVDAVVEALELRNNSELLTEKEAARYLNVQPQTLACWRHQGRGPHYIKLGSAVRYERLELEAYVQGQRVGTIC